MHETIHSLCKVLVADTAHFLDLSLGQALYQHRLALTATLSKDILVLSYLYIAKKLIGRKGFSIGSFWYSF